MKCPRHYCRFPLLVLNILRACNSVNEHFLEMIIQENGNYNDFMAFLTLLSWCYLRTKTNKFRKEKREIEKENVFFLYSLNEHRAMLPYFNGRKTKPFTQCFFSLYSLCGIIMKKEHISDWIWKMNPFSFSLLLYEINIELFILFVPFDVCFRFYHFTGIS